jgi:Zn-dependent peptidase ImmA (M78 family)
MKQSSENEPKKMKHETCEVFVNEIVMPKEVTMELGSKINSNLQSTILKSEDERMKIVLQKLDV